MGERGNNNDRIDKDEPLPTKCPACGAYKKPKVHKCPNPECGFEPERMANIEIEKGELVEISKTNKKLSPAEKRNRDLPREKKQEMYSAFMRIAHSSGHLAHLYKDFFGVWPKGWTKNPDLTTPKAMETARRFKTSKDIAYNKRRPA